MVLVASPAFLFSLPVNFFDSGQSVCLSVLIFDIECYGCGMTRALMHLIHFDFSTAWAYNKLSVVVLPGLLWLWLQSVFFLDLPRKVIRFFKSDGNSQLPHD
ncbi:MAG: DUF2752 domain-containing protein [Bacteroidota bacterium]